MAAPTNPAVAQLVPKLGAARRNEARIFALQIVRDREYRAMVMAQARAGRLTPQMETLLWHYAYGKPADVVEIGKVGDSDYGELSREALVNRAIELAERLRQAPQADDEVAGESATNSALVEVGFKPPTIEVKIPPPAPNEAELVKAAAKQPFETSASRAARLAPGRAVVDIAARRTLHQLGIDTDASPDPAEDDVDV